MTETLTGERGLYGELDGFIPPNDLVSEADFAIGCVLAGPIWIEHSGLRYFKQAKRSGLVC